MRPMLLVLAMLLCLGAAQASPRPVAAPAARLDHILLWGRGIDQVTSVMAVKLGFQVRPGHDPGGVANRYVRFADSSFIELLGITRPDPAFDPGMKEDQLALKGGPGSRSFGFRSAALDAIHRSLKGLGYAVTPFSPDLTARNRAGGCLHSIVRRCRATLSSSTMPPITPLTRSIPPMRTITA